MQNDSTTTVIEFAITDKTMQSIIFHLLQAHSDRFRRPGFHKSSVT